MLLGLAVVSDSGEDDVSAVTFQEGGVIAGFDLRNGSFGGFVPLQFNDHRRKGGAPFGNENDIRTSSLGIQTKPVMVSSSP